MRGLLSRIGGRVAAGAGLALLVLTIVAVGRFAGGPAQTTPQQRLNLPSAPAIDPTVGNDGVVAPTTSARPDENVDAALDVAMAFAEAWLRRDLSREAWHQGVAKVSTKDAAALLEGVEPDEVPATKVVGDATVVLRAESFTKVAVPMDAGTLTLTIVQVDEAEWLVAEIDWDRQ